jgi:hypothetical protein
MRDLADAARLGAFMQALGRTGGDGRVYFAGGATAVLLGWRATTIDADILLVPDTDEILREIPALKELLHLNVELANPSQFLPELPGWQDRSLFIRQEGKLGFFHYDLYAQALAKILRQQGKDILDVREMLARGLVQPAEAWKLFQAIEGRLFRHPNIDPPSFRKAVQQVLGRDPSTRSP